MFKIYYHFHIDKQRLCTKFFQSISNWSLVAKATMNALPIVKYFNVLKNILSYFINVRVGLAIY